MPGGSRTLKRRPPAVTLSGPRSLNFSKFINRKFSISVSNGTAALEIAVKALGIKKDDEVIIPTNTFIATAEVVLYSGAIPVLCDIEANNHNGPVIIDFVIEKVDYVYPMIPAGQSVDQLIEENQSK